MHQFKQFLLLLVFMILYVVGGTLLHESGHILIAKLLGYHSVLHYASMDWYTTDGSAGSDRTDSFFITLGGNMLLDLISLLFLLLLVFRKNVMSVWSFWISVFFSMLIYRHILLSLIGCAVSITQDKPLSYGRDERELAEYLHVSNSLIGIPLLGIALISCYVLFFVVLAKEIRFRLLIATGIGGAIGYIGWLGYLGPLLMP